ncbi:uncharacterized protein TM35_000301980 [Trypanosoma theileri]|uniref:Transmembrane protein n=1 Tax=Trypanosoma theileri TaxID=67003 RepID=A0A1X0NNT8_9TRYP|nr:uncharacterized protein TM35_000301980 [Trypanosoma theileri]ORC86158.1 hypothetical protein TM35_000301980 [Trypanosoma theileri]
MQQPASLSVAASPAPVIKRAAPVKLTYEEIHRGALFSVFDDFARQMRYKQHVEHLRTTGGDIQVISRNAVSTSSGGGGGTTGLAEGAISKESTTRLLKEHASASWGIFFYQWSLFGLTGVSSVATAMGFYLTIYHNRMFLPLGPMAAVVTWRMWNLLEEAWEQQRYIDNAAQLRESRKGNPMNLVARRTGAGGKETEVEEPSEDMM